MSRTPIHEALIRLQEDGFVRVLFRRGVVVCPISTEDIRDIYDVLIALEAAAVELLARQKPAESAPAIAELEATNAAMDRALKADDLTAWAKADERFTICWSNVAGTRALRGL